MTDKDSEIAAQLVAWQLEFGPVFRRNLTKKEAEPL